MKNYIKPVALMNNEVTEGVYAASGSADCWTVRVGTQQTWAGTCKIFRVDIKHSNEVTHISNASVVKVTFSLPIEWASAQEYDCQVSGNTVTITRTRLADAYYSGDDANYELKVYCGSQELTESVAVTSASISCVKGPNVQGGMD